MRPKNWRWFEISADFQKPGNAVVVLDGQGRIAGYAAYRPSDDRFTVHEIGVRDPSASSSLAIALGRRARRAGADKAIFHLPFGHPFATFCVRFGCQWRTTYPRNGGGMGRVIPSPLMERLAPELSRRLEVAGNEWTGALELETDIGAATLIVGRKSLLVSQTPRPSAAKVHIPQMALAQLVMGYRSAVDIESDPNARIPRRVLPVVDALFPKDHPYMWWSDRF